MRLCAALLPACSSYNVLLCGSRSGTDVVVAVSRIDSNGLTTLAVLLCRNITFVRRVASLACQLASFLGPLCGAILTLVRHPAFLIMTLTLTLTLVLNVRLPSASSITP